MATMVSRVVDDVQQDLPPTHSPATAADELEADDRVELALRERVRVAHVPVVDAALARGKLVDPRAVLGIARRETMRLPGQMTPPDVVHRVRVVKRTDQAAEHDRPRSSQLGWRDRRDRRQEDVVRPRLVARKGPGVRHRGSAGSRSRIVVGAAGPSTHAASYCGKSSVMWSQHAREPT